ncbi:hypothetical protein D3C72_1198680 [compost metagenome]
MAPWRLSSAASIRQASMTISWVAPKKPTRTAKAATCISDVAGFRPEMDQRPKITTACVTSIHDRRWPRYRVRIGILVRSIRGAHTNFSE